LDTQIVIKSGKQFSYEYIVKNRLVKIYEDDNTITIAKDDSATRELINEVTHYSKKEKVEFVLYQKNDLDELIRYVHKDEDRKIINSLKDDTTTDLAKLASDAPVVNLVNEILINALQKKVSDVHFEVYESYFRVRFRVNGLLIQVGSYPKNVYDAVCARIKIISKLDITNKRFSQDGKATLTIHNRKIDIRTSTMPTIYGESVVLRFLGIEESLQDLKSLGFDDSDIIECSKIIQKSYGTFILTGPTGSGKTTTLRSLINMIDFKSKNVITIEDPVEYTIEGINQVQINEKIDFGFNSILRNVLRQDPDVIMIGEMRDEETADLALRAAMTGHLVLSTLHTNDAVSSISRLLNMKIPSYVIESAVLGCAAQRLVRLLCNECKKEVTPDTVTKKLFEKYGMKVDTIYEPCGCPICNMTGFSGRTAIFELFELDERIRECIINGDSVSVIRKYLNDNGFRSLFSKALEKAALGFVFVEEVKSIIGEVK